MKNNFTEAQRKLAEYAVNNPQLSYKKLAELLGCSQQTVSRLCIKCDVRRKRGPVTDADLAKLVDTNCNQPETGKTHEGDKTHAS